MAENEQFVASTAPLTFQNFLEKMRHPSASELVKGIKVRPVVVFVVCQLRSCPRSHAPPDPSCPPHLTTRLLTTLFSLSSYATT
jgi:hypothetical protein